MSIRALIYIIPLLLTYLSCASTDKGLRAQSQTPRWMNSRLEDPDYLYFTGEAHASNSAQDAKQLAINAARRRLVEHCGMRISSESMVGEEYKNGQQGQQIVWQVTTEGDEITVQHVKVVKEKVIPTKQTYSSYVLIQWPKVEYASLIRTRQMHANNALSEYRVAREQFSNKNYVQSRKRALQSQNYLKKAGSIDMALNDEEIRRKSILSIKISQLIKDLDVVNRKRKNTFSVGVVCKYQGENVPCLSEIGNIKGIITKQSRFVSPKSPDPTYIQNVLLSAPHQDTLPIDLNISDSLYLVAVSYESNATEQSEGFHFADCTVSAALFDLDTERVVSTSVVGPTKGGHLSFAQAAKKACEKNQRKVGLWLSEALSEL